MEFNRNYQAVSADEAVKLVKSKDKIFIHSAAAAPKTLIAALAARGAELRDVEVLHLHTDAEAPYASEGLGGAFRVNNLFVGANVRGAVQSGRADYIPVFLSEVPLLFRRRILPLDVAMLQVSPPDRNGFCTLGTSVDTSLAAAQSAKVLIAELNPNMPRTHGDGVIHISRFDRVVEVDYGLPELHTPSPSDVELRIGQHVANLVEDGSTLQMGIGTIPNAALLAMKNHRQLGIHTEMFSDGVIDLVERGVITNEHKAKHRNHIVTGFIMGTKKLYDFVDDNPLVRFLDIAYVNDTATIRQNPKVVAINSAIEIDLTGQVCADSIGTRIYSGVGGQMDFIRGASLSEGGKPIIALPSATNKGISRIACMLKPGAGVVTTRAHVHYIVTEYGVAEMFGRNLRQRAQQLIAIAHPDHRERLEREAFEQLHLKTW
ncbi:acetyl-CoA hydrolase/transferase family protein [Phaeodactylibacter luteus]|uniref:4-hydroxybutyrate CoA-transferase n=1 Tax=Phaeodactylibacter luteus TaxID=1564516 RepID=A0A5C6RYC1_9BACT|nr:acetyl-CoA hydrolase/transferase C-terminal domain-containing protein [Phaeodactylibacter luteus]TXB67606.1 4-hydroxybutyrate CoA-transferase [Phaeodactylibacter luteus]